MRPLERETEILVAMKRIGRAAEAKMPQAISVRAWQHPPGHQRRFPRPRAKPNIPTCETTTSPGDRGELALVGEIAART